MKRVLIWSGPHDPALSAALAGVEGLEILRAQDVRHAARAMAEVDAMVTSTALWDERIAQALRSSSRLKWIQVVNVGVDPFERFGIPAGVTISTIGEHAAAAIAEHAIALLMALLRRLPQALQAQRAEIWEHVALRTKLGTLRDRSVVLLGFGPIGQAIAGLAGAFGARVSAIARSARISSDGVPVHPLARLHEVLGTAAALIVCAPLKPQTENLIDARALAALPPGALLVNVSRGAIIDTEALLAALDSGALGGAALDVTEPEPPPPEHRLWRHPNVLLTPHVAWAGASEPQRQRMREFVAANVRRFVRGEPVHWPAEVSARTRS